MLGQKFNLKTHLIAAVVLLALCLLAYGNILQNQFLMDDYLCYLNDDGLLSHSVPDLFTKGFKGIYRPVGLTFLRTQRLLFGVNPAAYHLCNLILFFSVCFLFFLIARRLSVKFELALLAAALYAVHPINNFLLNYKTAASLTLFTVFLQISTLFFLFYLEKGKRGALFASLFCYAVALLCHEIAFMLPVYLFILLFFLKDMKQCQRLSVIAWYALPFFIYLFLRANVAGHIRAMGIFSLGIGPFRFIHTVMPLITWYLSKLIWPTRILFTWDKHLAPPGLAIGWVFLFLALVVGFGFLFRVKKEKKLACAAAFFIAGFIPVGLASFVHTPKLDLAAIEPHWFGYSSMGFFLLVSSALIKWPRKNFGSARVSVILSIGLVLGLGFWTRQGNTVWQRPSSFCAYWLETNALNGSAWHCLADDYIGKNDKGVNSSLYDSCSELAYLGLAHHIKGRGQEAKSYYFSALERNRQCVPAYYGMGILFYEWGDYDRSRAALNKALSLAPEYYPAYEALRKVFLGKGNENSYVRVREILREQEPLKRKDIDR